MVPGQHVPQPVGKREHPLANGDVGEHMIDEVSGALGHPAPAAARAHRPGFAGKRDQPVGATGATSKAGEAPGEPATAQEVAKLLLDEPGHALAVALVTRLCEERLEVIADNRVEHPPVGRARLVGGRRRSYGVDVRMDRAARNPPALRGTARHVGGSARGDAAEEGRFRRSPLECSGTFTTG